MTPVLFVPSELLSAEIVIIELPSADSGVTEIQSGLDKTFHETLASTSVVFDSPRALNDILFATDKRTPSCLIVIAVKRLSPM